jgi:hypothetical protein
VGAAHGTGEQHAVHLSTLVVHRFESVIRQPTPRDLPPTTSGVTLGNPRGGQCSPPPCGCLAK